MRKIKKTETLKKSNCVVVSNSSYGKKLKGIKVFYEGRKPKQLKKDGSIKFGKHILENLKSKFKDRFRWIITKEENSIIYKYGIYYVRTSITLLNGMNTEYWDKSRDIKNDIVRHIFASIFPNYFSSNDAVLYVPGTLSKIINVSLLPLLSNEDRNALINFLPDFIASESIGSVNLLKATAEIKSLKELVKYLEKEIENGNTESWWQKFIKKNILIIQQGYIKTVEKINIGVGNTKFPDFILVTHDSYLDILEIKKPSTNLITFDKGRSNYYWDTELSKSIVQVENYLSIMDKHADAVRSYFKDNHKIDLQVLKPRGVILAGNARKFNNQKEKDDFRLLSQSLKNITFVTYDELATRLTNYIEVLENFSSKSKLK